MLELAGFILPDDKPTLARAASPTTFPYPNILDPHAGTQLPSGSLTAAQNLMPLFEGFANEVLHFQKTGSVFLLIELEAGGCFSALTRGFPGNADGRFAGPDIEVFPHISDEFLAAVFECIEELVVVPV